MSVLEMKVPSPGESITEVEIATWLVKDGDYVEKDQPIAEVDSDKATLELPAEESGIITLKAEEGELVQVGQVVCLIDREGKKPEGAAEEKPASKSDEKPAETPKPEPKKEEPKTQATYATGTPSPAAKKILDEKGMDTSQVSGTGRDGRITKADAETASVPAMGTPGTSGSRAQTTTKLSMLRRKLSTRLVSVKNDTAMLTTFNEVDMKPVMDLRARYKDLFEKKHGVKLGFMGFFTKAVTHALKEIPAVNAEIDGTDIIYKNYAHIGVAVGTDKGLVVPVVRDADAMSIAEIEKEIGRLGVAARDGKLSVADMQGGTFTISNGGVYGSLMSTPILNAPQSGILGMHKIQDRPMVVGGQVVVRPMMYLALSYDHRIVDGKEAVTFLVRVKETLEDPERLVLDL